jgi:hypothetical protein
MRRRLGKGLSICQNRTQTFLASPQRATGCISRPALVGTNSIRFLGSLEKGGNIHCFLIPTRHGHPIQIQPSVPSQRSKTNTTARLKPKQSGQLCVVIVWKKLEQAHHLCCTAHAPETNSASRSPQPGTLLGHGCNLAGIREVGCSNQDT